MHFTRGNEDDLGTESGHMALATKALAHPRFVGGIFGYHRWDEGWVLLNA
jgi:hypothetical protein